MPDKVYLLLGSNRGNRNEMLSTAIKLIEKQIGRIIKSSSVYETAPWGFSDNVFFLNQVVCVETLYDPFLILDRVLEIETAIGRIRTTKNYSSRNIDIDILFYNNRVIQNERLEIPHPRMHLRNFALIPMVEVAGDFIHPVLTKTMYDLLAECIDKKEVRLYKPEKAAQTA